MTFAQSRPSTRRWRGRRREEGEKKGRKQIDEEQWMDWAEEQLKMVLMHKQTNKQSREQRSMYSALTPPPNVDSKGTVACMSQLCATF